VPSPKFGASNPALAAVGFGVQDQRVRGWSVWKAVTIAVIGLVLVVVTAVGLVFLGIAIVAHLIQNQVDKLQEPASISSAQFHRVKIGFTYSDVQAVLGTPTYKDTKRNLFGGQAWYYGGEYTNGKQYVVYFDYGKVDEKFRSH
jgi:outer membrane protein assembly factor BamE (lipoprotein component of BamABCDE complex)